MDTSELEKSLCSAYFGVHCVRVNMCIFFIESFIPVY